MKKSILVCLVAVAMSVSSAPLFAAPTGTNPHPPITPVPSSGGNSSLASVALAFLGF